MSRKSEWSKAWIEDLIDRAFPESALLNYVKKKQKLRGERMKKYRSKPVEIEAIRFIVDNIAEIQKIAVENESVAIWPGSGADSEYVLKIKTLEGVMTAGYGDWLIRGTEGEFYPCKDSVFQRKYEEVKEEK